MRGARKTNMQQRDDPNYGPLGQVSHPLSVSAMSSLPSQPSHLHSVQEQSPYDIIEQQNTTIIGLNDTGCISADEGANVNEVKNSKQINSKKNSRLQGQRSPGPYNMTTADKLSKKQSQYAVSHGNINLQTPQKSGKSHRHARGKSIKSNGSVNNKYYAKRQEMHTEEPEKNDGSVISKLNNDIMSDHLTSGRTNIKQSVLSKTSEGLLSNEQIKQVPKSNKNMSEYMKLKSRQESVQQTNSKEGSQFNYNSSLNNSQQTNARLMSKDQMKMVTSQDKLVNQLQQSLGKNRTVSGAQRTTPLKSISRGHANTKNVRTLSAADLDLQANKDNKQTTEQKRVSLNQAKQAGPQQRKNKLEAKASTIGNLLNKSGDPKRQSIQNPVLQQQQQQSQSKMSVKSKMQTMGSNSDKYSEPYSGSTIHSKMKTGLELVKERQKSVQKKKSPKVEKESSMMNNRKIGMHTIARQGSPKVTRASQGSPKLIAQRYQRDLQNSPAQESNNSKYKQKKFAPTTRVSRKETKQLEEASFSRTELSNINVETILEQDSNLPTNPTPQNAYDEKSRSLISGKAGSSKHNDKDDHVMQDEPIMEKNEDDGFVTVRYKKPRGLQHANTATRKSYNSNSQSQSRQHYNRNSIDSTDQQYRFKKDSVQNLTCRNMSKDKTGKTYDYMQEDGSTSQDQRTKPFNPQAFKSQLNPDLRHSIQSRETDAIIEQNAMDMAASNVLTEMQQTPSQFDQKETMMTSSKNDKMSKASQRQEEDVDDDDLMGKMNSGAHDSGILTIDLDQQKRGSKKQKDQVDKKKPQQKAVLSQFEKNDTNIRQKSVSNQRYQPGKKLLTEKKRRQDYLDQVDYKVNAAKQSQSSKVQKSAYKPKSTQRAAYQRTNDVKRGTNAFEYIQQNQAQAKTNRGPLSKQSQKQKVKKSQLMQDSSDDYLYNKVYVHQNRDQESRIERIDFRSTEIELLENEIGHLREKLDRLIRNFDFKLFSKLGQVNQQKNNSINGHDDLLEDINPLSFQHFCQLLLKIHGVNSSPQTSENFLKSLNISHEIKGMRSKIDENLYSLDELKMSHKDYLSEMRQSKKGSLDEFIETSVKYAVKSSISHQLNDELQLLKLQNTGSLISHGNKKDDANGSQLLRSIRDSANMKRSTSKMSDMNGNNGKKKQSQSKSRVNPRLEMANEKRNAVSVLSVRSNKTPKRVDLADKVQESRNRADPRNDPIQNQNSIKSQRNSYLCPGTDKEQRLIREAQNNLQLKRSQISHDRASKESNDDVHNQPINLAVSVVKQGANSNINLLNAASNEDLTGQVRKQQTQAISDPSRQSTNSRLNRNTKYQELLRQQRLTGKKDQKLSTIQPSSSMKQKNDVGRKGANASTLGTESPGSHSRFNNKSHIKTGHDPLSAARRSQNQKAFKKNITLEQRDVRESYQDDRQKNKSALDQQNGRSNHNFPDSYSQKLQEKNRGLYQIMAEQSNPYVNYRHRIVDANDNILAQQPSYHDLASLNHRQREQQDAHVQQHFRSRSSDPNVQPSPKSQQSNKSQEPHRNHGSLTQTPSRSHNYGGVGKSLVHSASSSKQRVSNPMAQAHPNQLHRSPSQQTSHTFQSNATRRSKQHRRQQAQQAAQQAQDPDQNIFNGQGTDLHRRVENRRTSKFVDQTEDHGQATLFDIADNTHGVSADIEDMIDSQIVDLQLSQKKLSQPKAQKQVVAATGGFEVFAADIDLKNVRQSQLRPSMQSQSASQVPSVNQQLTSRQISIQAPNLDSARIMSTNSGKMSKRSPKSREPEPESLDKNIPTDNTPEIDNNEYETLDFYNEKGLELDKGYKTHQFGNTDLLANKKLLNEISSQPTRALHVIHERNSVDSPNKRNALITTKDEKPNSKTNIELGKVKLQNYVLEKNPSDGRASSSPFDLVSSDHKLFLENHKLSSQQNHSSRDNNKPDMPVRSRSKESEQRSPRHLTLPNGTDLGDRPNSKNQYTSIYTFQNDNSADPAIGKNESTKNDDSNGPQQINFGTITSVHQTQGIETDGLNDDTHKSSSIFDRVPTAKSSYAAHHTGNFNSGMNTDENNNDKSQNSMKPQAQRHGELTPKSSTHSQYKESEHREILKRDSSPLDRSRTLSRGSRNLSLSSDRKTLNHTPKEMRQSTNKNSKNIKLDDILKSEDVVSESSKRPNRLSQHIISQKPQEDPNLPFIFKEDPEVVKLRGKPPSELIQIALDELEEQIQDDIDLEEGQYLFAIELCPKSEREAILQQARKLDSVIDEESDEYNMTNSQYSMQAPAAPGYSYQRTVNQSKKPMNDFRSGNRSIQSANSMKSFTSYDGFNKSQLFVVREDDLNNSGNSTSPKQQPYVPYTIGRGRASDAMTRTWSEDQQNDMQNQLQSKLGKNNRSQRILKPKLSHTQQHQSLPQSPGGLTHESTLS